MSTETYHRRRAEGKCPYCGGKPQKGRVTCRSCQDKQNAKNKAYLNDEVPEDAKKVKAHTLCWDCWRTTARQPDQYCPWIHDFEPVEGWEAERKDIKVTNTHGKYSHTHFEESFTVKKCPLFMAERPAQSA